MASLFGGPKVPGPVPVVNPGDTQNRLNQALSDRLQSGGSNADQLNNPFAMSGSSGTGAGKAPTLTGLS